MVGIVYDSTTAFVVFVEYWALILVILSNIASKVLDLKTYKPANIPDSLLYPDFGLLKETVFCQGLGPKNLFVGHNIALCFPTRVYQASQCG